MTMDIMAGIAAASQALKIGREIREVAKDYENADLKSKIVSLVDSLSDAKSALIDAKEELQNAKADVEDLRSKLRFKVENTIRRNGLLYEKHADGSISPLPFCPKCADSGKFFTVLQERNANDARCPNCATSFATRAIRYWEKEPVSQSSVPQA